MTEANACECSAAPTPIFACSGAADVGEITDLAARELTRDGIGKMFCLAGVEGRVSGILQETKAAERIPALDGCPLDCVRLTLELAETPDSVHVCVTDLGMQKGETPATPEAVRKVTERAASLLEGNGKEDNER